jgi:uncharacterized membrane protein
MVLGANFRVWGNPHYESPPMPAPDLQIQPVTAAKPSNRTSWPASFARSFFRRPKIYLAVAAALGMALLLWPTALPPSVRAVIAWNTGGLVYLVMAWQLMRACPSEAIRKRAAREDEHAVIFLLLILLAISASFLATIGLISDAKAVKGTTAGLFVALAGATIFTSWAVTQVVFTLHYAHEYYRPAAEGSGIVGGLRFPEDDHPDYGDFFYFTTSIGATSQTSDVSVTTKRLRRLVAIHAIISFFFNTTILALAINLAAGLI